MKIINYQVFFTADDETPKCSHCDNICAGDTVCVDRCGAEHAWNSYSREIDSVENLLAKIKNHKEETI